MKSWERVFVGYFGVFLAGAGLYLVILSDASPVWRYLGGGLLCALGIAAIYSALTGKRLLSKVGPQP